jgi:E1A-binding protein p400
MPQSNLTPAQIFAQAGLQVQQAGTSASGTPVATLVKTANMAGVRTATPQQIRQLALHPQIIAQRKLPAQKVAQLAQVAGKAGVQTQLIVQQKSLPATMTVQQIQQVMKHVQPSAMQQFTHVSIFVSITIRLFLYLNKIFKKLVIMLYIIIYYHYIFFLNTCIKKIMKK